MADNVRAWYNYCPHCSHTHLPEMADTEPEQAPEEWERVIDQVFAGELQSGMIDRLTATKTAQNFFKAVTEGFGAGFDKIDYKSPDYGLLRNLERNCYQFAGAKNYQELRRLNDLLRDGDRLRSRSEFKREARKLVHEWNGIWQETEYNTAMNSAINARKWQEFESRKNIMPLLQFKIVKDEHTCPICKPFADVVRPMDDPMWNYATPSLHFGDRCTIIQLPDTKTDITAEVPGPDAIPKMFRVNLAKEQLAFPPDHPYYNGVPKKLLDSFDNPARSALPNWLFDASTDKVRVMDVNIGDLAERYNVTHEDIFNLCGGLPSNKVTKLKLSAWLEGDDVVNAEISTDQFFIHRVLDFKNKSIYNAYMKAETKGGGIGTNLFCNQVKTARELGFEQIKVHAAGGGGQTRWDGYYRWVRLGYSQDRKYVLKYKEWAEQYGRTEKNVSDLVSTDEGFALWKQRGFEWKGYFTLTGNSVNVKRLRTYLKKKGIDFKL